MENALEMELTVLCKFCYNITDLTLNKFLCKFCGIHNSHLT